MGNFLNNILEEMYSFQSEVNKEAYKDIYLLSNQVLSKNPLTSTFFDNYITKKDIKPLRFYQILHKLILYYSKSFYRYGEYLLKKLIHIISNQSFNLNPIKDEIILIDTFFLVSKIEKEGTFNDLYFQGLEKTIKKVGKFYAYIPAFVPNVSPIRFYKVLRLLKKQNVPTLTEYELLSIGDLFYLFYFVITYPLHVLKFTYSLPAESYEFKLLRYELLNTINQVTLQSFSRYLQGRKVSSIPCSSIKFISWHENQVIDKNMYKGLRMGKANGLIYGCQLFIYSFSILNIPVDPNEIIHGIVPDKVVVNGTYYLNKDKEVNSIVGPSFRYKKLFESEINFENRKNLLVLMSYFDYEIKNILKVLKKVNFPDGEIIIKFHPTTIKEKYEKLIPKKIKISDRSIYDLLETAKIVLGAETGSLVEAVSLGVPVIVVNNPKHFSHNPLPNIGKRIIWDLCNNVEEVNKTIRIFLDLTKNEQELLMNFSNKYKNLFFCEPTEEKIIATFDL